MTLTETSDVSVQPIEDRPIIVIDDDVAMRRACEATLKRAGYQVETFADGQSGLKRTAEADAGLIVVDLKMPGMSGMEVIEQARRTNPDIVPIVITGFATVTTAVEAMKVGAYDFIPKPFTAEELRVIITRGLERYRLATEAKRLRKEKEVQARKFITFVSHQLQSPLGAVQQYLDVMRHRSAGDIPERYRAWIDRCGQKIADMRQTINDWLTISKIEGGQLATERKPVSWRELVTKVLEDVAESAGAEQVALHDEVPRELPNVIGDRDALRMLLFNLVTNAIKYNRRGGEVRITGEGYPHTVRLSVTDTGVGIALENQERVFEEFHRVTDQSTAGTSGTGMGLPICRRIAVELGGGITLTSRPGEGSTFTVVLPRAKVGASADEPSEGKER